MIIDSHAHYSRRHFDEYFRYLALRGDEYAIGEGTRDVLLKEMAERGVEAFIEPAVELASNRKLLALADRYPGICLPAVGVHPTRTGTLKRKDRAELRGYAADQRVIAIGETGLDYHLQRKEQHRLRQLYWFLYQIDLADELGLPLILHIRDAYPDVIRVLKLNRKKLHGGVAHCFSASAAEAKALTALGFHIGIGGMLLQENEKAAALAEAVRAVPIERILIETDAPFVLPETPSLCLTRKQKRNLRNTSLILPGVIRRIAALKGLEPAEAEQTLYENTLRLLGKPGDSPA